MRVRETFSVLLAENRLLEGRDGFLFFRFLMVCLYDRCDGWSLRRFLLSVNYFMGM